MAAQANLLTLLEGKWTESGSEWPYLPGGGMGAIGHAQEYFFLVFLFIN